MLTGTGFGFNWKGLYVPSLIDAHSAWRQRADEFSDTLKTTILFGQYALNKYRGHYYAKSQNLARTLRAAYDTVLKDYDLLLMPTLPLKATRIPAPGAPRMEIIQRGFEMIANTCPFDVTGHPSIDRKSTRLNSSHGYISYAVFCLKKKKHKITNDKRLR